MINEAQREARRKFAGGSDAPAIVGVDPYRSAMDCYLEKTGQVRDFEGNEATDRGNLLEPAIMQWCADHLERAIEKNVMKIHASDLLAANFDGVLSPEESIEAKSSVLADEWGEPMTDEVPERVLIQVHHGFAVMPTLRVCWVPVLLPGYRKFDFRMYKVERNENLVQAVEAAGIEFMRENVRKMIPPADSRASLEVLKRMRRTSGKCADIDADLVDAWVAAKAAKKQAEEVAEQAYCEIIGRLVDADMARDSAGRQLTFFETKRAAYEVKAGAYRTLRIKK